MAYARSEVTRSRILEAALELFRTKGFAETTMREVAAQTQVSTGLAYYYFKSKEEIVHAFYQQAQEDLDPLLDAAQGKSVKFEERLGALIRVKLEYFAPNRKFLGALMGHAADPENPLSPFHDSSRVVREMDLRHFERALNETHIAVPAELKEAMPKILWMYQMGLILYWIYDRSPNQRRTHKLLDRSLAMVTAMIGLAGLPLTKSARRAVAELVELIEGKDPD